MKIPPVDLWDDVSETVMFGVAYAVPTAFLCWVTYRAGWNVTPVVALPLYCAYIRARRAWSKEFDERLRVLSEQVKQRQAETAERGDDAS